jgi:iron complex transport system permease protein
MKTSLKASVVRWGPYALRWRPRPLAVGMGLVALALVLGVLLLGTGTLALGPAEVLDSLLGTGAHPAAERIVLRVRLPRVLTAVFVGAALGMAGAIFQSISRNALAGGLCPSVELQCGVHAVLRAQPEVRFRPPLLICIKPFCPR